MTGRDNKMPETGLSVPIVTDHAVLRFIEHVHGIDTDAIRLIIANRCEAGVRWDKLDATDIAGGGRVLNHFLTSGPKTRAS